MPCLHLAIFFSSFSHVFFSVGTPDVWTHYLQNETNTEAGTVKARTHEVRAWGHKGGWEQTQAQRIELLIIRYKYSLWLGLARSNVHHGTTPLSFLVSVESLHVPDLTKQRSEFVVVHPPGREHLCVVVAERPQLSQTAQQTSKVLRVLRMVQHAHLPQHVQDVLLNLLHSPVILHVGPIWVGGRRQWHDEKSSFSQVCQVEGSWRPRYLVSGWWWWSGEPVPLAPCGAPQCFCRSWTLAWWTPLRYLQEKRNLKKQDSNSSSCSQKG